MYILCIMQHKLRFVYSAGYYCMILNNCRLFVLETGLNLFFWLIREYPGGDLKQMNKCLANEQLAVVFVLETELFLFICSFG